jgi:hypothetical protein
MRLRCAGPCCPLLSPAAAALQASGYATGLCVCREALERSDRLSNLRKALLGDWRPRRRVGAKRWLTRMCDGRV